MPVHRILAMTIAAVQRENEIVLLIVERHRWPESDSKCWRSRQR
jgi:hypothetical protein